LEGKAESGALKNQFSQLEEDLDAQEILKPIPIPKRRAPKNAHEWTMIISRTLVDKKLLICVESILICAKQFHCVKSLEIVQEIT
jgi:hypothetical protein